MLCVVGGVVFLLRQSYANAAAMFVIGVLAGVLEVLFQ